MNQHAALSIQNLSILYPGSSAPAVKNISFDLQKGEIACLLGPSGCGKTTLLRAIAGFLMPQSGEIFLKGESASNSKKALSPENRNVGVVFQDYALFPH